jgi:hypothetical protein
MKKQARENSLLLMDRTKAPFADNPSQGLIPLSITPLCANRMNGWATIVTHLIKYLSIVVGIYRNLSRTRKATLRIIEQNF